MEFFIIFILILLLAVAVSLAYQFYKKSNSYKQRFSKVISEDEELQRIKDEKSQSLSALNELKASYAKNKQIHDTLLEQVAVYSEEVGLYELGIYEPHFDFDASEKFKNKIKECKERQKTLVKNESAFFCNTEWTVEGSKSKGKAMTNRGIRLTSRAFNNECDAAISNVSWNNVAKLEVRLQKAFDAINKLNTSSQIHISQDYLNLKLEELRLYHEYKEKRQEEKEAQAEAKRQIREEAKLQKELDKAIKEEEQYKKLLAKVKAEAAKASGEQLDALNTRITLLTGELEEAHSNSERAKSMAQQTRVGNIYVISNIGSFGENVYKIGMTRRLDPMDRVKELGDASVPFIFDVHAIIYTEDAPKLESDLHSVFNNKRVNRVNLRKEFFNVSLEEIEAEVIKICPETEFIKIPEARDYRETVSINNRDQESTISCVKESFPTAI